MAYYKKINYDGSVYLDYANPQARDRRSQFARLRVLIPLGILGVSCVWFAVAQKQAQDVARFEISGNTEPVLNLPILESSPRASVAEPVAFEQRLVPARVPFEPRVPRSANESDNNDSWRQAQSRGADWLNVTVATGDNLSLIFGRVGLSKVDLAKILETGEKTQSLLHLEPGQAIQFHIKDGAVNELVHEIDYRRSLHVQRTADGFKSEILDIEPEVRIASAVGEIQHSLFLDGQEAGLPDKTIMELTDIFGWDIDFVLDLRDGDSFSVVFEEIYKNGEKVKNGRILAAEFINQGRRHRAVYYQSQSGLEGYYSDTGDAMRKAFLRTPVNFTRISSRFNLERKHPILNTIRAHKGVDYAAPLGTPIRATADGKVAFAGIQNGYGNAVVLQHGDTYSTLYGHMSRFARGIAQGQTIRQGQTIGYVGKTGLATGPHLHYEFRINGVHHDPLTVKLPNSLPIEKQYLADFRQKSNSLVQQLNTLAAHRNEGRDTMVADMNLRQADGTVINRRGKSHRPN